MLKRSGWFFRYLLTAKGITNGSSFRRTLELELVKVFQVFYKIFLIKVLITENPACSKKSGRNGDEAERKCARF